MSKYKYLLLILFLFGATTFVRAQVEEVGAQNSLFYYSGYLGKSDKLEFNLQVAEFKVSGSYILEESGELFIFNGRMATDKSGIGVLVFTEDNKYVASVEASLISDENDFAKEIKGTWKSASGQRVLPLTLKKVAELATSECDLSSNLGD